MARYVPLNPLPQVTKGKVAPCVLMGLEIGLRGVLPRNIMVDTQLREILK